LSIKGILTTALKEFVENQQRQGKTVPKEHIDQLVRGVESKIQNEPPPRIAFIGEAGVGKTSTLNALFNAGLPISHTEACTQQEQEVNVPISDVHGSKGVLRVYDMPGLGESQRSHAKHLETYNRVLKDVDVALWILDAQHRSIEFVQERLVKDIVAINHNVASRIVFALNKVDLVYPGETAWHPLANLPSPEQEDNINGRIRDVTSKIQEALPEWDAKVMAYSATRRYNLVHLFSVMLEAVPQKRQWVVQSRQAIADFMELVNSHYRTAATRSAASMQDPNPDGGTEGSGGRATATAPPTTIATEAETTEEKLSRSIQSLSSEAFARIAANKDGLAAWIKEQLKSHQ
jgi:uncharacterized protein